MRVNRTTLADTILILAAFAVTTAISSLMYRMQDTWPGISPAPSTPAALFYGLGDYQLSYRIIGLALQNAGDVGGRTTNFKQYDYAVLEKWLWLTDTLDPNANYVASLAAYYFSATQDVKQLPYLIDYLAHMGSDTNPKNGERWRWLAHAAFLTNYKINDLPRALKLAEQLSALDVPNMPDWARMMPAYVNSAMGKKKEARNLFLLMIADPKSNAKPTEINQGCWYIENNLRERGDGLDKNELYQQLCSHYIKQRKL